LNLKVLAGKPFQGSELLYDKNKGQSKRSQRHRRRFSDGGIAVFAICFRLRISFRSFCKVCRLKKCREDNRSENILEALNSFYSNLGRWTGL